MQTFRTYMLVMLYSVTSLSYAQEKPNINFNHIAEQLEYDLATCKARHSAIKSPYTYTALASALFAILDATEYFTEEDSTINRIVKEISPSPHIS